MVSQGRVVRYLMDYLLVSELLIFKNVVVQDPRHNYDHPMVIGGMCGASLREHSHYFGLRMRLPI